MPSKEIELVKREGNFAACHVVFTSWPQKQKTNKLLRLKNGSYIVYNICLVSGIVRPGELLTIMGAI